MSETFTITELYLEIEGENLSPSKRGKHRTFSVFLFCACGKFHIRPSYLKNTDFGKQKICECGNLIYTVGKKVVQSTYVSGKSG